MCKTLSLIPKVGKKKKGLLESRQYHKKIKNLYNASHGIYTFSQSQLSGG